jgi:hypothetical protein
MAQCMMCGSWIPDNQGSKTCSMCYGDIDHGKDGYYRQWAEERDRQAQEEQHDREQQARKDGG